jgi:hypothetical protein
MITLRPILCKIVDGISYHKDEAKIILIEKLSKKAKISLFSSYAEF